MNQFPINAMPVRAWPTGSYVGSTGGVATDFHVWRGYAVPGSVATTVLTGATTGGVSRTVDVRSQKSEVVGQKNRTVVVGARTADVSVQGRRTVVVGAEGGTVSPRPGFDVGDYLTLESGDVLATESGDGIVL